MYFLIEKKYTTPIPFRNEKRVPTTIAVISTLIVI